MITLPCCKITKNILAVNKPDVEFLDNHQQFTVITRW